MSFKTVIVIFLLVTGLGLGLARLPITQVICQSAELNSPPGASCAQVEAVVLGKSWLFSRLDLINFNDVPSTENTHLTVNLVRRELWGKVVLELSSQLQPSFVVQEPDQFWQIRANSTPPQSISAEESVGWLKLVFNQETWPEFSQSPTVATEIKPQVLELLHGFAATDLSDSQLVAYHPTWVELIIPHQPVILFDFSGQVNGQVRRAVAALSGQEEVAMQAVGQVRELDVRFSLPVFRTTRSYYQDQFLVVPTPTLNASPSADLGP